MHRYWLCQRMGSRPSTQRSTWLKQLDRGFLKKDSSPRIYAEGAFLSVEVGSDWNRGHDIAIDAIHQQLTGLPDPQTGNPVFARVILYGDAGRWAATWPFPGDILAQAAPGYLPFAALGTGDVFSEARSYGQTGYATHLPSMQGALVASGRGISATAKKSIVQLQDVASTATTLLGISPSTGGDLKTWERKSDHRR
jgi:hypothetical protein